APRADYRAEPGRARAQVCAVAGADASHIAITTRAISMIEFHPLANIFPLIEGADFDALVADIKAHGLAEKIVMHKGRPLDGRNRWRALAKLGLTDEEILQAHTEPLEDDTDPLAFVISKNLKRRHLDESQRAMVAARLATLTHGGDRVSEQAANLPVAT